MLRHAWISCIVFAAAAWSIPTAAQPAASVQAPAPPSIKRTPLQRFDIPATNYETVIGLADIAPNVLIGRHTHPGPESGYIMQGGFDLLIDGQAVRSLKAGDSYVVPANTIHDARTNAEGARVIATYVIPKGVPLAAPAK